MCHSRGALWLCLFLVLGCKSRAPQARLSSENPTTGGQACESVLSAAGLTPSSKEGASPKALSDDSLANIHSACFPAAGDTADELQDKLNGATADTDYNSLLQPVADSARGLSARANTPEDTSTAYGLTGGQQAIPCGPKTKEDPQGCSEIYKSWLETKRYLDEKAEANFHSSMHGAGDGAGSAFVPGYMMVMSALIEKGILKETVPHCNANNKCELRGRPGAGCQEKITLAPSISAGWLCAEGLVCRKSGEKPWYRRTPGVSSAYFSCSVENKNWEDKYLSVVSQYPPAEDNGYERFLSAAEPYAESCAKKPGATVQTCKACCKKDLAGPVQRGLIAWTPGQTPSAAEVEALEERCWRICEQKAAAETEVCCTCKLKSGDLKTALLIPTQAASCAAYCEKKEPGYGRKLDEYPGACQ